MSKILMVTLKDQNGLEEEHIEGLILYEKAKQAILSLIREYLEKSDFEFSCSPYLEGTRYRSITGYIAISEKEGGLDKIINSLFLVGAEVKEIEPSWKDKLANHHIKIENPVTDNKL